MKRIIVPLDGSALSERAIALGESLARAYAGQLELVHVLEEPIALDLLPSLVMPNRLVAETYLQQLADNQPNDLHVTTYVVRGQAATELLRLTKDQPDTMLVMSTHGRGGLGRLMLGSIADKVLRGSTVPVALVRGSAPAGQGGLTRLLVPLDESCLARSALPAAIDLAQRTHATLGLVRVCVPLWTTYYAPTALEMVYLDDAQMASWERESLDHARQALDHIAVEIRDHGVRVAWEVRSGRPADEIIRAAETTQTDLIVMSTHGRGGMRRLAIGSVTNEVLHRGTTPLLVIPSPTGQQEHAATDQLA